MKLLIVDDEDLTRNGLIASIDWKALNISEVLQAGDGYLGLEMAKKHRPEIILSDVRMPRMDGISMVDKLSALLPETSIIFMSGYSDKEYLKAAIKYKAVGYVEKPIHPLEIQEAVAEAAAKIRLMKRTKLSENRYSFEQAGKLALALTIPLSENTKISVETLEHLSLFVSPESMFTSVILKFMKPISELGNLRITDASKEFCRFLKNCGLQTIYTAKHDQYLIYHVFGDHKPDLQLLEKIGSCLRSCFQELAPFFIAVGESVTNIENVYHSYSSAVILLQSSFFCDYNSILISGKEPFGQETSIPDPLSLFTNAINQKNQKAIGPLLDLMVKTLKEDKSMMPNQVKDIYYRLFTAVKNSYEIHLVSDPAPNPNQESILEYLENCNTLTELNEALLAKTSELFHAFDHHVKENSTIFMIKDFIRKNYNHETLSVKDISSHVFLSTSYVCTLFKTETGHTLNQYLTEYRIEQAKQLLSDPRYKISDISSRVGYSDGNYFGKSFKKLVGLSPSEFREKILD